MTVTNDIGLTRAQLANLQGQVAKKLGIPVEVLKVTTDMPLVETEESEHERRQQAAQDRIEEARLSAVREAFLQTTPAEHPDWDVLREILVSSEILEAPTPEQLSGLFRLLPAELVGQAIAYGLEDDDVGDEIYAYVEAHPSLVKKALQVITR